MNRTITKIPYSSEVVKKLTEAIPLIQQTLQEETGGFFVVYFEDQEVIFWNDALYNSPDEISLTW